MSKHQMLRQFASQQLSAASEDIFGLFESTTAEYEEELSRSKEENERQRKLLLHRADVQQLLVIKEGVPPGNRSLDQEDPEPPHIKEEEEGEQLRGLEEADIKLPFTPVPVRSEDDDAEKPQSSQL